MTIRCVAALALLFVSCAAAAADVETTRETQPKTTAAASPPTQTKSGATPGDAADDTQPVTVDKTAVPDSKSKAQDKHASDGDFKPSEHISEDMSVAYPVDI